MKAQINPKLFKAHLKGHDRLLPRPENKKWVNSLADVDMYRLNIGVPRVVFGF